MTKQINHNDYPETLKSYTVAQLLGTIQDCKATLEVWKDHPNAGYYLDEIHYCVAELKRRNG